MQHGLEFLSRLVFVLGVCSGGYGVVSVLAIDRFLIDKYRCSSRGRGEGGLGVAPLPSTNIAQFFCMNGLFHCGVGAVQQEWQQIKSVGFSV